MNDREMLEYAAKAAGIDGVWQDWDGMDIRYGFSQSIYSKDEGYWNPLDDDGDAFRLAVKLNLSVKYDTLSDGSIVQVAAPWHESFSDNWWNEWLDDDSKNATRRAITRAAAEIGRSME